MMRIAAIVVLGLILCGCERKEDALQQAVSGVWAFSSKEVIRIRLDGKTPDLLIDESPYLYVESSSPDVEMQTVSLLVSPPGMDADTFTLRLNGPDKLTLVLPNGTPIEGKFIRRLTPDDIKTLDLKRIVADKESSNMAAEMYARKPDEFK